MKQWADGADDYLCVTVTGTFYSALLDPIIVDFEMGRVMMKKFLKPYVLKMFFSNRYVSAQVVHSPTSTTVTAASTQEKALRTKLPSTSDVEAAASIGRILADRLISKDIPAISFQLEKGQRYHGKRKALVDNLRESGIKLI